MSCKASTLVNSRTDRQRGNTLIGVMVGLMVGVVIAVGVALYINFGPKPFSDKDKSSTAEQSKPISAQQSGPVALPGKPGDAPLEKPQFDFYKILPGGEASAPVPSPSVATPAPVEAPAERLFLQVGAFQDPSEADNLKARLALMGLEASVQRAEVPDKGVLHRVRVGPYTAIPEADTIRARLAQEGIESNLIRSKPKASGTSPKQ